MFMNELFEDKVFHSKKAIFHEELPNGMWINDNFFMLKSCRDGSDTRYIYCSDLKKYWVWSNTDEGKDIVEFISKIKGIDADIYREELRSKIDEYDIFSGNYKVTTKRTKEGFFLMYDL